MKQKRATVKGKCKRLISSLNCSECHAVSDSSGKPLSQPLRLLEVNDEDNDVKSIFMHRLPA